MSIKNETLFNYFTNGMEKELQAQLRLLFARMSLEEQAERRREREQLKQEIIAEVLSSISVTVDVSEAIQEIEDLRKAIDRLGR